MSEKPSGTLVHDWNEVDRRGSVFPSGFRLVDETLRDGIQSPSVRNPSIEEKVELLHLMEDCGIESVDVGLPGAGEQAVADVTRLVQEIADQRMSIVPNCAARTHPADIGAVVNIVQATGVQIEVCAFLGASPVRRAIEGWDLDLMVERVRKSGDQCQAEGVPFTFVTEDTTRSDPVTLGTLFRAAVDHGASRLILCDTTGHATPDGLRNLVRFARSFVSTTGASVELDWHGHNDRGLALTLALSAVELGVNRVHGTCLGVGERVGNAPIDLLLLNLRMLGALDRDVRPLRQYVEKVSEYFEIPIHYNYPAFGADAFRTATGVHAAAIAKAIDADRNDLADQVYSSVPAYAIDRKQEIAVGFYSGRSNVRSWLRQHGITVTPPRVDAIMELAKSTRHTLSDQEIIDALRQADLFDTPSGD